jgi:hypothetical protein
MPWIVTWIADHPSLMKHLPPGSTIQCMENTVGEEVGSVLILNHEGRLQRLDRGYIPIPRPLDSSRGSHSPEQSWHQIKLEWRD